MNIEQLVSPAIPVLSSSDTGERALALMEQNNITQLPVIVEDQYIALVKEDDLLNWDMPSAPLSTSHFLNYRPAVAVICHPYDALRIAHQQHIVIVPVIDNENKYLGSITRDNLLNYMAENSGLNTPGGIIVLWVAQHDYTLYEIARICENEDVVITSMQMNTLPDGNYEITLKLNRTEIEAVIASLERHNYKVTEVYGQQSNSEDMHDRYNLLMNFINM